MKQRLGWPGRWAGKLYDDGGLPVHLYPFMVNSQGQGPVDDGDPDAHPTCWCIWDECLGIEDGFGFPISKGDSDDITGS